MAINKQKLHQFINEWHLWQHKYHSDKRGNIIFQNQELFSNVRFTHKSFHNVRNNLQGFEKIPDTIMTPQEVWSYWKNPEKQTDVYRNYLKDNYVVSTLNEEVINAFLTTNIDKYRKGVIVL